MQSSIYEENYEAVYKYLLYLTNDVDLAHDMLQETFFRYLRHNEKTDVQNVRPYLIRLARNLVYDYFRRKKIIQFFGLSKDERKDVHPLPEELITKNEDAQALYLALQKIKPSYREVIILRYIEDYSVAETSSILGKSEVYVKNQTYRGIAALRELMKGGLEDEEIS